MEGRLELSSGGAVRWRGRQHGGAREGGEGATCIRVRTSSRGEVQSTARVRAEAPAASGAYAPAGPSARRTSSASYSGR